MWTTRGCRVSVGRRLGFSVRRLPPRRSGQPCTKECQFDGSPKVTERAPTAVVLVSLHLTVRSENEGEVGAGSSCGIRAVEPRDLTDRDEPTIVHDTVKTPVHQPHVRDDNGVHHEENNRIRRLQAETGAARPGRESIRAGGQVRRSSWVQIASPEL
jgi:hypothetical protein